MHCATFSHQAAVERYNRDPNGNRSAASNDFLSGFCAVLQGFSARQKLKKGSIGFEDEWVDSNLVYQEYIKDRHHVHLSATRWKSVAGFVRFLGQKKIAEIKRKKSNDDLNQNSDVKYIFGDEKEDSSNETDSDTDNEEEEFQKDPTKRPKWFIKLIDKSPEAILAAKSKNAADKKASEEESLQIKQMALVNKLAQKPISTSTVPVILAKPSFQQQQQQAKTKGVASIFEESSSSEEEQEEIVQKKNLVLEILAKEEMNLKNEQRPREEVS